MMRNHQSLGSSVANSVRQGSIAGPEPTADFQILQVINNSLTIDGSEVTRVVVFHANSPTDEPSPSCKGGVPSSTPGEECNVYDAQNFDDNIAEFGCKYPSNLDSFWCPTDREDRGSNMMTDTDLIGVYIEVEHSFATGFFGQTLTLSRTSILPLERGK